ncbi:MAG: hypothetical protein IJS32_00330, partial [Kiritimatiellae bacterium]|nr:hypothetical protein [Kiritimatiellia bacterium]
VAPAAPAAALPPARAAILAAVKLHYVSAKQQIDCWQSPRYLVPCDASGTPLWEEMRALDEDEEADEVPEAARLGLPAPALANPKMLAQYERTLKSVLRYKSALEVFSAPEVKLFSRLGESEGGFRIRAKEQLREARDKAIERLRAKYAPKTRMLKEKERKALAKVESVEQQAKTQSTRTLVSFGTAALSILLGRKAGGLGRATTGITGMAQGRQKKLSIEQAKEDLESVRNQLSELESEVAAAIEETTACYPDEPEIAETALSARTSDTIVRNLSIVWRAV